MSVAFTSQLRPGEFVVRQKAFAVSMSFGRISDMNVQATVCLAAIANDQQSLYYQEQQFPANVAEKFAKFFGEPPMTSPVPSPVVRPPQRFATTRWSLIVQTRNRDDIPARAALTELCEAYWLPVYGFMRRQTSDVHEAQDLTQGFFASLLARNALANLNPDRGRFRSFLLAAAKHFVCNEWDKQTTVIRGGKVVLHSLDYEAGERELSHELSREQTAEAIFERRWAFVVLDQVLNRLRAEYELAGKPTLFECLSPFLSGDHDGNGYSGVCESQQLSPEAARVAAHRMRKRYRQILSEEIAHTTATPQEVDDEIRHLFSALRRS